jgi:hypothetical protein
VLTKSFWIGGFECSCHHRREGRRLDLIAATGHDRYARADYARLRRTGLGAARDGVRWHLVEPAPGRYDFSSLLPMAHAARSAGVEVIWDLCHYGWPEGLDIFRPRFIERFAAYAGAVARVLAAETDGPLLVSPVNEISFWSWAGGDSAHLEPYETGRGFELKAQLVRASLAAIDAIWNAAPRARILHADPAVRVLADPDLPEDAAGAEAAAAAAGYHEAQFQAWDMIVGRLWPQLGGDERYLGALGVNYYPYNQWILNGPSLHRDHPLHRPFRDILADLHARYGRPLLLAETGAEGDERAPWLAHIGEEVRAAMRNGVPVLGICLYPILDHPGWADDRHCDCGLWGYPSPGGEREAYAPLARELARQMALFQPLLPAGLQTAPAEETEQLCFTMSERR